MNAEHLRAELLAVLAAARGPITTTEARVAIAGTLDSHDRPVVAEQVYRALAVLQRRGVVRRADEPSRHGARWELAMLCVDAPGAARGDRQQSAKGSAQ